MPYLPPLGAPRPGAKVVWAEPDPVLSNYKSMEHQADLWLAVTAKAAARAIYEAATALLSKSDMSRIAERRERLEAAKRGMVAENERLGQEAGRRRPMHPRWVAYQLGKILEPNAIVVDDALSNSDNVCAYHQRVQAGTYFSSGGSSGGWGIGAAVGAEDGGADRDVHFCQRRWLSYVRHATSRALDRLPLQGGIFDGGIRESFLQHWNQWATTRVSKRCRGAD